MTEPTTPQLTERDVAELQARTVRSGYYDAAGFIPLTQFELDALIRDWRALQTRLTACEGSRRVHELDNHHNALACGYCAGPIKEESARLTAENAALREQLKEVEAFPCAQCGGPHDFDTSVPSVVWNRIIRAHELPDYLCMACIVREFVRAGESFTAELWNEEFNGVNIEVVVNGTTAKDAALIQEENNSLRNQVNDAAQSIVNEAEKVGQLMQSAAIAMKDKCVEKVEELIEAWAAPDSDVGDEVSGFRIDAANAILEALHGLGSAKCTLCGHAEGLREPEGHCVICGCSCNFTAIQSLTLDQVEKEKQQS